jgi:transposase InsO family protein
MSKARLVITSVVLEGRPVGEVVEQYRISRSWVYELLARYKAEGETAFEPRSRRPKRSPNVIDEATVDLIIELRRTLRAAGHDAGPETIVWHLAQHHQIKVSRSTVSRYLVKAGLVVSEPKKRPKSSYIRFEASMPNETWQSDFTHYSLATSHPNRGHHAEIISWLDDCSRYALSVTAHSQITGPIVLATFQTTMAQHGIPASTLTDNAMVFTTRFAGGRGGLNSFEHELARLDIIQKNSRPNHPTTCGKVERFQQTMKNWLHAQPDQPATIPELQTLLDAFTNTYNHHRPHRSLPHQATPAAVYQTMPKATPAATRDTHHRVRHDRIDKTGCVTLRHNGRLHHIGIGRTHAGTHVILLIADLDIRVVDATTGELLRHLNLNTDHDYQPRGNTPK